MCLHACVILRLSATYSLSSLPSLEINKANVCEVAIKTAAVRRDVLPPRTTGQVQWHAHLNELAGHDHVQAALIEWRRKGSASRDTFLYGMVGDKSG